MVVAITGIVVTVVVVVRVYAVLYPAQICVTTPTV